MPQMPGPPPENRRDAAERLAQALAELAEHRDALREHRDKSRNLKHISERVVGSSQLLWDEIRRSR